MCGPYGYMTLICHEAFVGVRQAVSKYDLELWEGGTMSEALRERPTTATSSVVVAFAPSATLP
jgi:hypothetical protein